MIGAGTTVGILAGIEEAEVQVKPLGPTRSAGSDGQPSRKEQGTVPSHVKKLYEIACKSCKDTAQCARLAQLFNQYGNVFSQDDGDVGQW